MSNCISSRCDTLTDGCCVEPCATSLREWRTGTTPAGTIFWSQAGGEVGVAHFASCLRPKDCAGIDDFWRFVQAYSEPGFVS